MPAKQTIKTVTVTKTKTKISKPKSNSPKSSSQKDVRLVEDICKEDL